MKRFWILERSGPFWERLRWIIRKLSKKPCGAIPAAIVVGIDARNGKVALRGWVDQTALTAVELARRMKDLGVERVIYTDVARDGMLTRRELLRRPRTLCREAEIRVIASGGVSAIEDVRALWERRACGIEGVILGRALYDQEA